MANLPSLSWNEQLEVLSNMKRSLGEHRNASNASNANTSPEDIHSLTTSLYHLSLEQTLSNLIAILNSSVTRVVTSGLDFLTLLFQRPDPKHLAEHSQAVLQLISQYVNAVYMTSDNVHSRIAFPFLLSLCSLSCPRLHLPALSVFARKVTSQSCSLYYSINLIQCIRAIVTHHAEEISKKTEVLRSLLEAMHTFILIESTAVRRVVKESLNHGNGLRMPKE